MVSSAAAELEAEELAVSEAEEAAALVELAAAELTVEDALEALLTVEDALEALFDAVDAFDALAPAAAFLAASCAAFTRPAPVLSSQFDPSTMTVWLPTSEPLKPKSLELMEPSPLMSWAMRAAICLSKPT